MILKALEMQGFKSFPDKTVLSFGSGMTSVVGPNGSGKSNISDAVRWVLGEQGAKKLRGAKMEDVIFGGTSARKAQGFAEVSLKLDNSDRVLGKDADEVVVTRRYYRSGESEYKVNGEVVRLKDVHELFMDTGLGRDGYSMVSQGKIADMVSSKSNERREMFEEAAGISFFRYRRADALRRLDQTQENLIRLKDIFTELQTRVGPLKEQSETARKFLVLAQEKKELEISLWLHTIEKAKDNLRRQEDKIALAGSQHDDSAGELESIEEKIEQIIKKSQDITVEIDNIRRGISLFEEQASAVDSNIAVCKNTIELNLQAIERIKKDKSQTKETQGRIDDQIKQAQESITVCEKLAQEKREELGAVYGQLEDLLEENNESTGKTQGLSNKMGELARELSDKRVIESTAESSSREIRSRLGAIDQSLSENDQLIAELLRDKDEGQSVIKSKIDEIEEYTNAVNGYGLKVKNREGKVSKLREEADRLSIDLRQKESKRGMLLEMEKNMEGYSGSVKAVIKESKRGTMRGVHGPVSQLITVDSKYSHAIEVALGAAIQNIVVDTENDAKRAINFLKEQKLGRATFLPICAIKQRELNEKGVGSCDGFIGIASDLVKCDEKYTDIVKSLLARTVVADEMDSAIKVAKKYANRFKIVTLDGQVINAGGSMTGGSRIHNSGLLGRGNEIEKINKEIKKLSEKARQSADSYKSAVEELAADRAGLMGAQAQLTTAQEEKIMADSEMTLVSGRIEAAKSSKEELVREKESAILRIEEFKKQSEEAQVRIAELSEQIKGIESEIEKMTGRRENIQQTREELSQSAADINLEIMAAQKDIDSNRESIEALKQRKTVHDSREFELQSDIDQTMLKNEQTQREIEELLLRSNELRERAKSADTDIGRLVEQRQENEQSSGELRLLERQKSSERERLSGELARLQEQKAAMLREYDETVNKLYDEYELTHREAREISSASSEPSKTQRKITEIKNSIKALGNVNVSAIEEYSEVSQRYEFMGAQIEDIEKSRGELIKLIEELTMNMSAQFKEQFVKINNAFGETFKTLFDGGKAELILEDERDVLQCGIDIKVQPPGKNIQNIDLLSGGEKGLSAIALLFAILKVTPAPFCIFDEVEAALDDINVIKYAQYVRRMTNKTQFILITHRRGTMEESDRLYGVTMQENGVSKLLELNTADMVKKLGIA